MLFQEWRKHGFRPRPGGLFSAPTPSHIEPYCAVCKWLQICSIGAFSYTHSPFPVDFSLGRYCSVAWDVRPPLELISTSLFLNEIFPGSEAIARAMNLLRV